MSDPEMFWPKIALPGLEILKTFDQGVEID